MSKNIVIQENGVAQTLNTISRVVTSGSQRGDVDWVPEDETQLGEITIKQNGEYKASDKGVYAFSKVTVKATGKAVGIDPDTGEWEVIDVDEDGFLEEHGLPTYIRIVTPPDKTSYIVGQPILKKGMVVIAYYEDDSEYGVVPLEDITLDPMIAPWSGGEHKRYTDFSEIPQSEFLSWSDYVSKLTSPLPSGDGFSWTFDNGESPPENNSIFDDANQRSFILKRTDSNGQWLIVAACTTDEYRYIQNGEVVSVHLPLDYEIYGKTYYYWNIYVPNDRYRTIHTPDIGQVVDSSISFSSMSGDRMHDDCLILWGGEYVKGTEEDINAIWKRVGDEEELSDTFKVNVDPILPTVSIGDNNGTVGGGSNDDDTTITPPSHGGMQ